MDLSTLASFTLVAALLVMSPGPNGALLVKTVPVSGRAAGFTNIAGFVVAFYLHGALSVLGISAILMQSAQAFVVVKWIGAAYLCWIGVKALQRALRSSRVSIPSSAPHASRISSLPIAFAEGFLTNALNPKVSMFYLAAFPQFITPGDGAAWSAVMLVVVHSLLAAAWFAALVLAFERLAGAARDERFRRALDGATGAVFIGFGARLATFKP